MQKRNLKELVVTLFQQRHLLSIAQILLELKKHQRSFNKTSVYRAVEQLLSEKILCQHFFLGSEALYELQAHHHAHLVCTKCGLVETAACNYEQPRQIGDFVTDHHHITLFGSCKNCQLGG